MKESTYDRYKEMGKTVGGQYYHGYYFGLASHFHVEVFGGEDHKDFVGLDDERGEGYRDGLAGRPPRGFHENLGNNNSLRDEERVSPLLTVRLTQARKAGYVKAAQREGMKLSQWVFKQLDDAVERVDDRVLIDTVTERLKEPSIPVDMEDWKKNRE